MRITKTITLIITLAITIFTLPLTAMPFYEGWYWEHQAAKLPRAVQTGGWFLADLEKKVLKWKKDKSDALLIKDLNYCWDLCIGDDPVVVRTLHNLIAYYNQATKDSDKMTYADNLLDFIKQHKLKEPTFWYALKKKARDHKLTSSFSWKYLVPAALTVGGALCGLWYLKSQYFNQPKEDQPHIPDDVPDKQEPVTQPTDNDNDNRNNKNELPKKSHRIIRTFTNKNLGVTAALKWGTQQSAWPRKFAVYMRPADPEHANLSYEEKNKRYGDLRPEDLVLDYEMDSSTGDLTKNNHGKKSIDNEHVIVTYNFEFEIPQTAPWLLSAWKGSKARSGITWVEFLFDPKKPLPPFSFIGWDLLKRERPCIGFENTSPVSYGHAQVESSIFDQLQGWAIDWKKTLELQQSFQKQQEQ